MLLFRKNIQKEKVKDTMLIVILVSWFTSSALINSTKTCTNQLCSLISIYPVSLLGLEKLFAYDELDQIWSLPYLLYMGYDYQKGVLPINYWQVK